MGELYSCDQIHTFCNPAAVHSMQRVIVLVLCQLCICTWLCQEFEMRMPLFSFQYSLPFIVVALGSIQLLHWYPVCQRPLNSVQILHSTTISVIRVFRRTLIMFSTISSVVVLWHSLTMRVYSTTYLFLCLVVTLPTHLPTRPRVPRLSAMPNRPTKQV